MATPNGSDRARAAAEAGAAVILSANPIHDTGGGQRSAQLALELLDRGFSVLFVSHGNVTETVDLRLRYDHPRLESATLSDVTGPAGREVLERYLAAGRRSVVLTQVPVYAWEPVLALAHEAGAVTVYDCIDRWDSELGRGWYRRDAEERIARTSDVLVASAAELVQHVEVLAERPATLLPNAFNSRVFGPDARPVRPPDLPGGRRVALYVGALWGGWLDWELVDRAARALPETTFVFVGDRRREGRGLPDNCVFLGLKPQTGLPGYLAHADVAFLPWSADEVTQATSPLKVYEFVAMGLPVVGPAIETLRGIPGVRRFTDEADFVEALRETGRATLAPENRAAMADFARDNSWVQRVDALVELARAAADERARTALTSRTSRQPTSATLSVVIPAYNHERWIRQAIESVRAQSLPAGELVVVDDGSSDGTPALLEGLVASGLPDLRLLRQANRGAHAAINRGVAVSRGEYVTILNSDDELAPERLEHAWGVVRDTGAALVVGSVRLIDADGAPLPEEHDSARWYREARAQPERSRSLARALLRHNFAVTTSNFFFHRELWRRLGGFRPYRYAHDYDFILRALELCPDRVVYVDALRGVRYRVHETNTILEDVERALDERRTLLRRIRSPARRLRALGGRAVAAAAVSRAVRAADDPGPLPVDDVAGDVARTLRVGLVAPSLDHGGLEEVVALLATALPAHGIEPLVLCTHAGGAVADRLLAAGVDVTVAGGDASEWQRWAADAVPDVLSTHFVDAAVVETLSGTGAPIFETVHNTYAWFGADAWAREVRKHGRLTGTVAVSEVVARYYARYTDTEPTPYVVPNGVHPARAASVPRAWARSRLQLPDDARVLVHLGRVTLQKNVVGLLDAFEAVLEREPRARLLIAGSLSDRGYLARVRGAHGALLRDGAVRIRPPVPHVGTVLSAGDVYVSNSLFEGWSLAASEAAWTGLPLVLSDCGSARQLVGAKGAWGRVVPNALGDPLDVTWERLESVTDEEAGANRRALADAVLDVLGEEAGRAAALRVEGRARARAELAPNRVAAAYAALFRGPATT